MAIFRLFRRSPGLAASVAITIGLGIGASLAIFALLYHGLIEPPPFRDPARLVTIENVGRYYYEGRVAEGLESAAISALDYRDIETQAGSLEQVGGFETYSGVMSGADRPRPIWRTLVTPKLLPLLGVRARMGRALDESDFAAGAPPAAMVTETMWRARFASDPGVVGRIIRIDDQPFTVVGVLPDAVLRFLRQPEGVLEETRDEWVVSPLLVELAGSEARVFKFSAAQRDSPWLNVVGRIAAGKSVAAVRSEMDVIARRLVREHPKADRGRTIKVSAIEEWRTAKARGTLTILLAAAVLVLLVASSNAAGLILADNVRHGTEAAIRQALGAGPARLVGLEVLRSLALALPGGVLGVGLAALTLFTIDQTVGNGTGSIVRTLLVPRVALVAVAITVVAGLIGGAGSAWSLARRNLTDALKEGGMTASAGKRRSRAMRAFVALQVTAATALVLGAGLMLRSVWNILAVDLGFDVRTNLVMHVRLPPSKYPTGQDQRVFFEKALARVRAIPGVEAAGMAGTPPLTNSMMLLSGITVETPEKTLGPLERISAQVSTVGYLEALHMKLVRGRWFRQEDNREGSGAVMVDQAFSRKHLAGIDPLQASVRWGRRMLPIVGVVADVRRSGPLADIEPTLYSLEPFDRPSRFAYIVVSAKGSASRLAADVLREVTAVDPSASTEDPKTMADLYAGTFATRRRLLVLLGSAAAIVLLLTVFSLVSALAQFVAAGRRDIAIRLSLGAAPRHVAALLGRHVAVAIGAGLAAGAGAGFALARMLSAQLFELKPGDPATLAAAVAAVATLAIAAAVPQVWKATRIDSAATLKTQ